MMLTYILLSLLNGVCISLSRSINSRLSIEKTAFHASVWNHVMGFLFMTLLILSQRNELSTINFNAPFYAYLGGMMGAIFVAINSFVLPQLGATQTATLVISGQMISGLIFDQILSPSEWGGSKILAIILISLGIILSRRSFMRKNIK